MKKPLAARRRHGAPRTRRQAEPPAAAGSAAEQTDAESVAGEEDPGAALDATPPERSSPPLKAPTAVGKPPHAPGVPDTDASGGLPLPHERDESIDRDAPQPDPLIEQARRDLQSGQVDTDLRATPGLDAEQRERLLRRGRR